MNILFFIHSLEAGGAERVTVQLANHWVEKGWQVTVVTIADAAGDFYQLHPEINRIALGLAVNSKGPLGSIVNNLRRISALRRVLRGQQPEVALAMMATSNILLALAGAGIKGIVRVGSERNYPPRSALGRAWVFLRARLYGWLDAVVAQTNESAGWLAKFTSARKISVIPNAAFWPLPVQEPHLPVPDTLADHYTLLAVGRLVHIKGFDLLISAFQRLAAEFPQWDLFIVGEGPERQALQEQIDEAGLGRRAWLPGRAGNVGRWYEAADAYVMSSRSEGFPNTLVEAMACGIPCVSFDCDTGPRDIIRQDVDGLLVPAEDGAALEAALRRVMGDAALRQRYSARAVDVRDRFSEERVAGIWERLFEELR